LLTAAVKHQTTEAKNNVFSNHFDSVGTPEALFSGNGTEVNSKHFPEFLTQKGTKQLLRPPDQENACEKTKEDIPARLLARKGKPKVQWPSLLRQVVNSVNDNPHKIRGFSSQFLQFGLSTGDPKIPIENARRFGTLADTSPFRRHLLPPKINPGGVRHVMPPHLNP
jgi:hypothetical protein